MVDKQEKWDIEIRPRAPLFELNLHQVWKYRDLLLLLVRRDFIAQYKQTVLGPVWHFIQPVLTSLIYLVIFSRVANIPTDGIHPILFYLSGIALWNYFSITLNTTATTFLSNAAIFGKVYFPRIIMPLSVIFSNLIRFVIQLVLLFLVMLYFLYKGESLSLSIYILLIPALLVLMAGIGLGLGIIISSITTRYRDFAVLLTFAVQLGMYASPVIYPASFMKNSSYAWIVQINPLTPIIEAFRYALFQRGTFNSWDLVYTTGFMLVVVTTGLIMFNKVEKTFMDTV